MQIPSKAVGKPECPVLATARSMPRYLADSMAIWSVLDVLYGPPILGHCHRSSVPVMPRLGETPLPELLWAVRNQFPGDKSKQAEAARLAVRPRSDQLQINEQRTNNGAKGRTEMKMEDDSKHGLRKRG